MIQVAPSPCTRSAAGPGRAMPVHGDPRHPSWSFASTLLETPDTFHHDGEDGQFPANRNPHHDPADPRTLLECAVRSYRTIRLDELKSAALMERIDTKFLLPIDRVAELLGLIEADYRVLTIHGSRIGEYETLYLDTEDLALYRAHLAGRPNRLKIRIRTYRATGDRFIEVKATRAGRTAKTRAAFEPDNSTIDSLLREASPRMAVTAANRIFPIVRVGYSRVTLVAREAAERVTIDVGLNLELVGDRSGLDDREHTFRSRNGSLHTSFVRSAIVEIKQPRHCMSPALIALRGMGMKPRPLSKYCVGVASLVPGVKMNRFRRTLDRLSELEYGVLG